MAEDVHGSGSAVESTGTTLCTSCGLCCAGALHNAAVLDEDEIAAATELGLPVLDRAKPGFALPCPKLAGTLCGIYGNRPRVCGRYRCNLLQRLDAGELSLEEARATVATAKSLIDDLKRLMPEGMTLPEARALVLQPPPEPHQPTGNHGSSMRLRLAATAVSVYIDRHFRNAREGKLLRLNRVEDQRNTVSDG
jgi:hypothetical protein